MKKYRKRDFIPGLLGIIWVVCFLVYGYGCGTREEPLSPLTSEAFRGGYVYAKDLPLEKVIDVTVKAYVPLWSDRLDSSTLQSQGLRRNTLSVLGALYEDGAGRWFDGVNDEIIADDNITMEGDFSIEVYFIVPEAWIRDINCLFGMRSPDGLYCIEVNAHHKWVGGGSPAFSMRNGGDWLSVSGAGKLLPGKHHIMAVYNSDSGEMNLYVDGILKGNETFDSNFVISAEYRIGNSNGYSMDYNGGINEVWIYEREVEEEELDVKIEQVEWRFE